MNELLSVAQSLSALGHEARLEIFRLLVKAGHRGMTVGQIGAHLGVPASTLAHHLRKLSESSLILQSRNGREINNKVDFGEMDHVIGFLTDQCCIGVAENRNESAAGRIEMASERRVDHE